MITTSKVLLVAVGSLLLLSTSCKKEVCKQCFTEETIAASGEKVTTEIGQVCDEELANTDGKTFTTITGPARTYCE